MVVAWWLTVTSWTASTVPEKTVKETMSAKRMVPNPSITGVFSLLFAWSIINFGREFVSRSWNDPSGNVWWWP